MQMYENLYSCLLFRYNTTKNKESKAAESILDLIIEDSSKASIREQSNLWRQRFFAVILVLGSLKTFRRFETEAQAEAQAHVEADTEVETEAQAEAEAEAEVETKRKLEDASSGSSSSSSSLKKLKPNVRLLPPSLLFFFSSSFSFFFSSFLFFSFLSSFLFLF